MLFFARGSTEMPEAFDDGQDEFTSKPTLPQAPDRVVLISWISIIAAFASFIYSVFRIGKGTMGHSMEYSMQRIPIAVAIDVVVFFFAVYALKEAHDLEGTVARGMALASVALSFLGGTIAAYSWYTFAELYRQAHP